MIVGDGKGGTRELPVRNDRVAVHDLVGLVVKRLSLPADRIWVMSVRDILLSLTEPPASAETASDAHNQAMQCLAIDERLEMFAKLTLAQRIELAEWKAELMS